MPTESAPRTPRGWPTAATSEPTGAESLTEAAGMPVPSTRSRTRSASVSRAITCPSRRRPSTNRTTAREPRTTWALVTTYPGGQSTPEPSEALESATSAVMRRRRSTRYERSVTTPQSSPGALAHAKVKVVRLTAPDYRGDETLAHAIRLQHTAEIHGIRNAGPAEGHQDVADHEPTLGGGTGRLHGDHDHRRGLLQAEALAKRVREAHGLGADSEVGAGDVSAALEPVEEAVDDDGGNGQVLAPARPRGVDADHLPAHVHQGSAGESWIERQVEVEDGAARATSSAGDGADHAPARPRSFADGQHDVAGLHRRRVTDTGRGHITRIDPEHREIDGGIAAGEGGGNGPAVGPGQQNVVLRLHGVVGGDDEAGTPVHARRARAPPGRDAEDALARLLHGGGEPVRESDQIAHGSSSG